MWGQRHQQHQQQQHHHQHGKSREEMEIERQLDMGSRLMQNSGGGPGGGGGGGGGGAGGRYGGNSQGHKQGCVQSSSWQKPGINGQGKSGCTVNQFGGPRSELEEFHLALLEHFHPPKPPAPPQQQAGSAGSSRGQAMVDKAAQAARPKPPPQPSAPGIMAQFFTAPKPRPRSPPKPRPGVLPSAPKRSAASLSPSSSSSSSSSKPANAHHPGSGGGGGDAGAPAVKKSKKPLKNTYGSFEEYSASLTPVVLDEVVAEMLQAKEESPAIPVKPPTDAPNADGEFQYMWLQFAPGSGSCLPRVEHGDCMYVSVAIYRQQQQQHSGSGSPGKRAKIAQGGEGGGAARVGDGGSGKWEKRGQVEFFCVAMSGKAGGLFKVRMLRMMPEVSKLFIVRKEGAVPRRHDWAASRLKPLGPCIREWRAIKKVGDTANVFTVALAEFHLSNNHMSSLRPLLVSFSWNVSHSASWHRPPHHCLRLCALVSLRSRPLYIRIPKTCRLQTVRCSRQSSRHPNRCKSASMQ